MSKIPGVGEIQEGVLERDPLDDGLQLKVTRADGSQEVLRLQDMLSEYVGHAVRLTVGYSSVLEAAERAQVDGDLQSVRFSDLVKR